MEKLKFDGKGRQLIPAELTSIFDVQEDPNSRTAKTEVELEGRFMHSVRKSIDLLDWLVQLDMQHYKTESFPDYSPDGNSYFYIKGSSERFTSTEMIKIFYNKADDELMQRWNYAISDAMSKKR